MLSIIKKIPRHYKEGTLGITTRVYLKGKLPSVNFKKLHEGLLFSINGGFFEKPRIFTAYTFKDAFDYNETRVNTESWKLENIAIEKFLNQLPNELKILDVPFGTGRFVKYYQKKNFRIFGLDKSIEMIEAGKRDGFFEGNVNIFEGDAAQIPFDDGSFDLVVSFRFLPHIINYGQAKQVMKELSRLSSKYLIVQLGERKISDFRRRKPRNNEKMGTWFYPNEVKSFIESYGFEILEKSPPLHGGVTIGRSYYKNKGAWYAYLCQKITTHDSN